MRQGVVEIVESSQGSERGWSRRWVGHDEVWLASESVRWVELGKFVVGWVGLVGRQAEID